jgi:hypothetical protein
MATPYALFVALRRARGSVGNYIAEMDELQGKNFEFIIALRS